jgi:O-antigen/teichoic acid export membrane protein
MDGGGKSTMGRDVVSAYVAAGAKIASWAVVSAMVYRYLSPQAFAVLALIRGTIGLLNYAAVGLGPALVRLIAEESNKPRAAIPVEKALGKGGVTACRTPEVKRDPASGPYTNGLVIALFAGAIGLVLTWVYAKWFGVVHRVGTTKGDIPMLVSAIGLGTVLRLVSDAPGAVLQARGRIATDNLLLAATDVLWLVLTAAGIRDYKLNAVGNTFWVANLLLLAARFLVAGRVMGGVYGGGWVSLTTLRRLLSFGSLVVLAQLADYLYAPTDYILIDRLLDPMQLAAYAPAVQIDGALLVLVSGLGAVLLPKSAVAHAAGDLAAVRNYYVRGTLASVGLLVAAGACVWTLSPWIFRMWLGNEMPATQAILPLVLVHTVVGGSSAVARSILLGMGKVRVFTIAVLIAGASNVAFSVVFVKYLGLELKGIVLGTIVAVVLRCGIWMPWYVMRAVRGEGKTAVVPQLTIEN